MSLWAWPDQLEPRARELTWRRVWIPGAPECYAKGSQTVRVAPKRLKDWKEKVWVAWRQSCGGECFYGGVALQCTFFVKNPKKDLDNMVKALLDGLKNVAFGDDRHVYALKLVKEPVENRDEEGVEVFVAPYLGPLFPERASRDRY